MIQQEELEYIVEAQRALFMRKDSGQEREKLADIACLESFASIITGIRRCGKSTVMMQLLQQRDEGALYIDFSDLRLGGFSKDDFLRLFRIIQQGKERLLFFDELQMVAGWEQFILQLLNEEYKVFITGSNATMLSAELGTLLTGRHLSTELFPFSYKEYVEFKSLSFSPESVLAYMQDGGFPQYVKTGESQILATLVDDILYRDIGVRHAIRDFSSMRQLVAYLITSIGSLVSANRLTGLFGTQSASTLLDYFSHLKSAYLFDFVPMFHHSLQAQARNPKKVYVMDLGLYTHNTQSGSPNLGARFENLIFLHLRRKHRQICYFKGHGECDFITMHNYRAHAAVQVCYKVTPDNLKREFDGLMAAMQALELNEGYIITLNQADTFEADGKRIYMVPAHEFMVE